MCQKLKLTETKKNLAEVVLLVSINHPSNFLPSLKKQPVYTFRILLIMTFFKILSIRSSNKDRYPDDKFRFDSNFDH